ncbi:protein HID1-like isoform X2 [Phycodurus eques]|uniref:protein HID1-like isoform X2 n=1 Tax=Phycodurus eques TaxID=693459 RepID=UPI002ACDE817|nr:protein HID1-like isoform X2 [Phycodurus eques]
MGSGESKLDFRKAVIHLTSTTQPVEASDDVFWEQFWADPSTSVQDIFALVPAAEIRALREESPSNLATLCYKAVEKLGRAAVRGCPSERERAAVLNCARLLTRVLPFIYEDADWRGFFWSSLPGAQNQEAVAVADTVDSCELIWEAGVGFAQSPAPNSAHDSNRAELLKLLLTCFSEVLYLAPTDHHVNPWVLFFCSASNRHALPLFTSLLNVVCAYDPSGSGFPYNHLLFSDRRQILVVQALQVLIVTLERRGPRAAPAADALHASAPSAGDETDWARKPVCQLPVQDPPRRGLELHPERSEPAPQQPSGADLPAKLCQEDLLPPGDPHPLLEALRLQQEIPLLRAEEQRRSGRAGPHPVFPQRSPRRSVWRGAGPHGRLHPASAERREELWRAPQQTLHAARPHGRPRLQRDTRRPAARDLPQDDDLRTSASAAALRLSAHRRRQRFCTFWRFSPRRGSFSRPRATTSSSSSCWRSSTTSSSTSLTVSKPQQTLDRVPHAHTRAHLGQSGAGPSTRCALALLAGNSNLVYSLIRRRNLFQRLANLGADAASIHKALLYKTKKKKKKNAGASQSDRADAESRPRPGPGEPEAAPGPGGVRCRVTFVCLAFRFSSRPPFSGIRKITQKSRASHGGAAVADPPQTAVDGASDTESNSERDREDKQTESEAATGLPGTSSASPPWTATPDWVLSWKSKLPLQTIMRLLQVLVPQVEKICIDKALTDESEILKFLQRGTLVGLLPVPHPILIRKYQADAATSSWFRTYTWGVLYSRNLDPPIWYDTDIRLFEIQRI